MALALAPTAGPARPAFTFYVGVHQTRFLWWMSVPMMVSRRTLQRYRPRRPATAPWALDSGGFTELSLYGRWTLPAADYAGLARHYAAVLGPPDFCAPQDWMCEPAMLHKTGLSVQEHQRRTIDNYGELRTLAPELPWMPVLQGWTVDDYLRCLEAYGASGFDLCGAERVGLGTVCRRQSTREGAAIVRRLWQEGLRLHGFGFKVQGLARIAPLLSSADSHAWNYWPRYRERVPGCCGDYAYCSNCWHYAQAWQQGVVAGLDRPAENFAWQLAFEWSIDPNSGPVEWSGAEVGR